MPLALVGNKTLSEIYGSEKREVSWEEGKGMAASFGVPLFEVSTETKENIDKV